MEIGRALQDINQLTFGYVSWWEPENQCKLTKITVSESNPYLCTVDGVVYTKDMKTLKCYPSGTSNPLVLPETVTKVGENSLNGCVFLPSIELGKASISGSDVRHCTSLKAINAADDNPALRSENGIVYSKDMKQLVVYPGGISDKEFSLPETVTTVGDCAFYNKCLSTVRINAMVESIGKNAFYGCTSLETIYCYGDNPPVLPDNYVFNTQTSKNAMLYVPQGRGLKYVSAEGWREFRHVEEMDSGVEDIVGEGADIRVVDGSIVIDGAAADTPVEVYDMTGKVMYRGSAGDIPSMPRGIYIVCIGGNSVKVAV